MPAFYVTPERDGAPGAFDDAGVLLRSGEDRLLTFRAFGGRDERPPSRLEVHGLDLRAMRMTEGSA